MKNRLTQWSAVSLAAWCALTPAASAAFNSGSTGAYGALDIATTTTLELPADGIFHCTTVNIAAGATLTFNPNALNTPVYILATGDVTIAGAVRVDGKNFNGRFPGEGGPGGFRGGYVGTGGLPDGGGLGPGAGGVNNGGNYFGVYGNDALIPLIGGSGGGAYSAQYGGGGGGGAILIASNTRIQISGLVSALAGASYWGIAQPSAGSAGAIRLVAPVVSGNGTVTVGDNSGRIRLDTEDRLAWRNLTIGATPGFTYGSRMVVFPTPIPQLDVTEVAGTAVAVGAPAPVVVVLPPGSPTAQTIKVRVANLTGSVDVAVAVTPEYGNRTTVITTVDMSGGGPVTVTVPINVPVGVRCAVEAFKK